MHDALMRSLDVTRVLIIGGLVLVLAIALGAAFASRAPSTSTTAEHGKSAEAHAKKGEHGKSNEKDKTPENPVSVSGTVQSSVDAEGQTVYTLDVNGTTYQLSAGPDWWWGENNPLAKAVGKSVTIDGEAAQGSTEISVLAIDGVKVRDAGRPPWAGGPNAVGSKHPGSSDNKTPSSSPVPTAPASPVPTATPSSSP